MILGIGIDILRVERIRESVIRFGDRFLCRVFTDSERRYCEAKPRPYESYAARFAVKEAAFKALGRGWDECGGFTSVEVVSGESSRPSVVFHGKAAAFSRELVVTTAHVSITHDGGVSAAVVIIEG